MRAVAALSLTLLALIAGGCGSSKPVPSKGTQEAGQRANEGAAGQRARETAVKGNQQIEASEEAGEKAEEAKSAAEEH
jgi:hypothetical protein